MSQVVYWLKGLKEQNFGDYLSSYLLDSLFLPTPRKTSEIRLIGSFLHDDFVPDSSLYNDENEKGLGEPVSIKTLIAWGGGIREVGGLSEEKQAKIELLSVRGPISASELRCGSLVPMGDPALLLPALYQPKCDVRCLGKTICIPHFHEKATDRCLLEKSGADLVLRPNIIANHSAIEAFIDAVCSAQFVLSASLHGAIVAAAYMRPFAYWNPGSIDLPTKWADFSESIKIHTEFVEDVVSGELFYQDKIAPSIVLPNLWELVCSAPFLLRPDALLRIMRHTIKPITDERLAKEFENCIDTLSKREWHFSRIVQDAEEVQSKLSASLSHAQSMAQEEHQRLSDEISLRDQRYVDLQKEQQQLFEEIALLDQRNDSLQKELEIERNKAGQEQTQLLDELAQKVANISSIGEASQRSHLEAQQKVSDLLWEIHRQQDRIQRWVECGTRVQGYKEGFRKRLMRCALGKGALSALAMSIVSLPSLIKGDIKKNFRKLRQMKLIQDSGLFDEGYYLSQDPNLIPSRMLPLEHYFESGHKNEMNPNEWFDSAFYLKTNRDIKFHGVNPLLHFIRNGAKEGRSPHPGFDLPAYLEANPDVRRAGINPLRHFLKYGRAEGRKSFPIASYQDPGATSHIIETFDKVGFRSFQRCDMKEAFLAWHGSTPIHFPPIDDPEISVIIPVYKGRADLENCLRSIAAHRLTEPRFEVILVDDCPDEPVLWSIPYSGGLRKHTNETNLGFLKTCNLGATMARGRYLCFLNSDTIVSAGWLHSLHEALEEIPNAGMAGSMLLNLDGTIQDAGWSMLSNGWGHPIGRGKNPSCGAYTYRRAVDCVTGACFLVRRALFESMGGLDTQYAPAFYEEFDLAFRMRELGLKVLYEPRSHIVHLGSASYGPDQRDRLSKMNHAKFIERHTEALSKKPSSADDEFILQRQVDGGPILLVVDSAVPEPNRHAGDVTISRYLELLAQAGWQVVFGPMDGKAEGPAAEHIERLGIELIRQPSSIEQWLRAHGKHLNAVWLARPDIADVLIDQIRVHSKAQIAYYTHDLHHLRLQREADLNNDPALQAEADRFRELEKSVFSRVDHIMSPSSEEALIIQAMSPGKHVTAILPYFYESDEILSRTTEHFESRKDLIFVGGFPHIPNVDAAVFLVNKIMPLVWKKHPDVRLLLIGYAPPPEVKALAGDQVIVTGQVPLLEPYFDKARVFVAPLRYGAGVKGKIVEAMRMGVPVVTSQIGAEGIGITIGSEAMVAENEYDSASAILELLDSPELCASLSQHGADLVRRKFSRGAANLAMEMIFSITPH